MADKCQHPHCDEDGERYHQNTKFVKEELNWVTLCPEHREENDEYWREMWPRYYSDCM